MIVTMEDFPNHCEVSLAAGINLRFQKKSCMQVLKGINSELSQY